MSYPDRQARYSAFRCRNNPGNRDWHPRQAAHISGQAVPSSHRRIVKTAGWPQGQKHRRKNHRRYLQCPPFLPAFPAGAWVHTAFPEPAWICLRWSGYNPRCLMRLLSRPVFCIQSGPVFWRHLVWMQDMFFHPLNVQKQLYRLIALFERQSRIIFLRCQDR